jgi:hypothetical protein
VEQLYITQISILIREFKILQKMKVYEYRIVKIEKGLFLIEYKVAPYGVWHEVEDKKFKSKPKAEAWIGKNFECNNFGHK